MYIPKIITKTAVCASIAISFTAASVAFADATGNRYSLPRYYHSEISAAETYMSAVLNDARYEEGIIIDVRAVQEYEGNWSDGNPGHPEFAYNIPFPHVYGRPSWPGYEAQEPQDFYDAMEELRDQLGLDYDANIYTLCRTGYRSVLAANILSSSDYGTPFTNVRNIWQGYVGRYKPQVVYTSDGEVIARDGDGKNVTVVTRFTKDGEVIVNEGNNGKGEGNTSSVVYMDLDNDGEIEGDDKDGWSEYQGLPVTTDDTYSWNNWPWFP